MKIWNENLSLEKIHELSQGNLVSHMGIEVTEIGDDYLKGTMLVVDNLKQPFGILHGGANCVLAETLGSFAANFTVSESQHAVGLSINTSHIKAVRNGVLTGMATPVHLGKTTQIWDIKTYNDANELTSSTQLTMAILNRLGKTTQD